MACRGVLFALTDGEVRKLRSCEDDDSRLEYLQEDIEERYFSEAEDYVAETDKAWDAIHRSLSDGRLSYDGGSFPLSHVILGGESLYDEEDYIISLKTPEQVKAIGQALKSVSKADLRRGYDKINEKDYGFPLTDDDFEYTWEWFTGLNEFYARAASEGRTVIFTADQ